MNDLIHLWQLQVLEDEVQEIEKKEILLKKKRNMKHLKNEYENIKSSIHTKIAQYQELERNITRDHLKNRNLGYEIKDLENKLYDGSIQDFKVYSKMEKEIEDYKIELDSIETDLLHRMDDKVILEKDIKKMKKRLQKLHECYQEEKNQYIIKKEEFENQYRMKTKAIEELLPGIKETYIIEYRDIKKRVQPAMAKITNGLCSGCHMNLSIILLKELQKGDKLYTCESCGRILYLEEL